MNKIIKIILFLTLSFLLTSQNILANDKIKIGLLIPLTGQDSQIGQSIVKATQLAINKINNPLIEIYPRNTNSNPETTLRAAKEMDDLGIKIVIGPVFNNNLTYLNKLKNITFLSLTNKTINLPKNIISSGINATSQVNTIKKFLELEKIEKAIFLTPNVDYEVEIKKAIKESKVKVSKHYIYETDPTKLTKQIEKITNYKIRKQNLSDEIKRIERSDLTESDKERRKNFVF